MKEEIIELIKNEMTALQGKVLNVVELVLPHNDGRMEIVRKKIFTEVQDTSRYLVKEVDEKI